MKFGFFWPFFENYIIYVDLADFKMILAAFWALAHSRHYFWTQNEKFSLEILHVNL